jgi:hypothetical protein
MVLELGQRPGIRVRMTALKPDDAVSFAAGRLTCLPRRCRFVTDGHSSRVAWHAISALLRVNHGRLSGVGVRRNGVICAYPHVARMSG